MTAGPLPVASLPALPVGVCVLRIELKNKIKQLKVTEPSSVCAKIDRRNRPSGGPILSHWGAEEEV